MEPLQNAVWHALTGPQRTVAERHGNAVRVDPDIGPFSAVPDEPTPDDWDALRTLVGPGNDAMLFREMPPLPDGWEVTMRGPGVQMASPQFDRVVDGVVDDRIVTLGPADVPEMMDLVERTQPGPFRKRTIEYGTYLGVRDDGALVAMAGERLHVEGWQEVSAVCTDPAHRGQGLASLLTRAVAVGIQVRGERAFLQAWAHNDSALRLYEHMGFTMLRDVEVVFLRAPD